MPTLTELRFGHFKSFQASQTLHLAPITLLLGPKSGGKSSVLQTLLLLKQTAEASGGTTTAPLIFNGPWTQLGSFENIVHRHATDAPFTLGMTWEIQGWVHALKAAIPSELRNYSDTVQYPVRSGGFDWQWTWDASRQQLTVDEMVAHLNGAPLLRLVHPLTVGDFEYVVPTPLESLTSRYTRWVEDHLHQWMKPAADAPSHRLWRSWVRRTKAARAEWINLLTIVERTLRLLEADDLQEFADYLDREVGCTMEEVFTELHRWRSRLRRYRADDLYTDTVGDVHPHDERGIVWPPQVIWRLQRCFPRVEFSTYAPRTMLRVASSALRFGVARGAPEWVPIPPLPDIGRFVEDLATHLKTFLHERVTYIGPRLERPPVHWVTAHDAPTTVGPTGEYLADLLVDHPERLTAVNALLEQLSTGYRVEIQDVDGDGLQDLYLFRLIDTATGLPIQPNAGGYGGNRVLPLVVETCATEHRVILVEQPESHLHPRVQAALASVLATGIAAPHRHQYLIETHSRHLVWNLQRLIRDGQLRAEDVCAYHITKTAGISHLQPLRLDVHYLFQDGTELAPGPRRPLG